MTTTCHKEFLNSKTIKLFLKLRDIHIKMKYKNQIWNESISLYLKGDKQVN